MQNGLPSNYTETHDNPVSILEAIKEVIKSNQVFPCELFLEEQEYSAKSESSRLQHHVTSHRTSDHSKLS